MDLDFTPDEEKKKVKVVLVYWKYSNYKEIFKVKVPSWSSPFPTTKRKLLLTIWYFILIHTHTHANFHIIMLFKNCGKNCNIDLPF